MKKQLIFCCTLAVLATNAFAEKKEGFYTQPTLTTVAQAAKMKDDTMVRIKGTIEKKINDEKYTFKDETGSITIEIDDKYWQGLSVSPADVIEISGEVDQDMGEEPEIDVKHIQLINR